MTRRSKLTNLITTFFILAVLSLVWRQGNVLVDGIKPFEVLVAVVLILVFIEALLLHRVRKFLSLLSGRFRFLLPSVLLLIVTIVAGYVFSRNVLSGIDVDTTEIYLEFARILFAFTVFILSIYVTYYNRRVAELSLWAIAFSPVVLMLAFNPAFRMFFTDNGRLIGARNDPNYLATFLALGLIFASVYFLYINSRIKWFELFYIVAFLPLFIWTYSRAAFLSLSVVLCFLSLIYLLHRLSLKRMGAILLLGMIFISSALGSLYFLPDDFQLLAYRKSIESLVPNDDARESISELISSGDERAEWFVMKDVPNEEFSYSRGELWSGALHLSYMAPLGLGPAYGLWAPVGRLDRAHNLFLEVALTAGWLGFLVFFVLVFTLLRRGWRFVVRRDPIGTMLTLGFIYLLLNGMFLDMFTLRWLWLIMGMIAGHSLIDKNEKPESISSPADL